MHVLLAEDEPVSRLLLQRHLTRWGHEVVIAVNGAEAWQLFQQGSFPLILSDWMMPEMDGIELIRRVRAAPQGRYVYTILLTARSEKEDLVQGMEAGADDFLTKPIDPDVLRVRVREAERILRLEQTLLEQNRVLREQKAELERDLHMAREVQQALLPQSWPVFPRGSRAHDSALRFCHRYVPAGAVGGDFFDVLPLSDTQAGIFICDVVGHGVRPALLTAMMRAFLDEIRRDALNPDLLLAALNGKLCPVLMQMNLPMFSTALYAVLDLRTGNVSLANAGHPAPLHLRKGAGTVTPLVPPGHRPGPPLGVAPDAEYTVASGCWSVGDRLLFYTDGLIEVPGEAGESFGTDRLRAAVQQRLTASSQQLLDQLLIEIPRFTADQRFDDDVCALCVEWMRQLP